MCGSKRCELTRYGGVMSGKVLERMCEAFHESTVSAFGNAACGLRSGHCLLIGCPGISRSSSHLGSGVYAKRRNPTGALAWRVASFSAQKKGIILYSRRAPATPRRSKTPCWAIAPRHQSQPRPLPVLTGVGRIGVFVLLSLLLLSSVTCAVILIKRAIRNFAHRYLL